jgi:hypothetical protein
VYIFYFGKIYNLSYSEEYLNDTFVKIHRFNCTKVLVISWYIIFPTIIRIFKDGYPWVIYEASSSLFDFYYKGYIGDNFICAIQIFKFYSDVMLTPNLEKV